ncbi:protein brown-like [Manduca sexta]|uniref:protein brown-like n=1 Tax=Manduca sexta TaxID=7130 RepID=UPI00188E2F93|nr:protein brown-like [Manduca sexta]
MRSPLPGGSFLSATFDKMETAALIAVPFDLIGLMFSGIYLNLASASPYYSWLRYISGFYYGTESISILQWDLVDNISCADAEGMPCIRTGAEVLNRFGYEDSHFWRNFTMDGNTIIVRLKGDRRLKNEFNG